MRILILLYSIMLASIPLFAQEKPEQQSPEYDMPNLAPDTSPFHMPNAGPAKAFGADPESGEPHFYLDPESGLYFDFHEKKIRNFKNGEVYTFEELKKKLEEASAKEEEQPKKII